MYNVLWFDDQHNDDEMVYFKINAEESGFLIHGVSSYEEGEKELEQNYKKYDVILLDGMFFEKKDQKAGSEDEGAIGSAIAKINELKSKKIIPWFVLSGKDSFTKGNSILKSNKAKCFDKTNPNYLTELFAEMKSAADNSEDFQLKYKYQKIFELCDEKYLDNQQFDRLWQIVNHIESPEILNTNDKLNELRKVIEQIFKRLSEIGVIPSEIINDRGWISNCSKFLSNVHPAFKQRNELIPAIIGENIFRILNITQDASHEFGNLKLKVNEHLNSAGNDYLYRSCVYLLFDILIWFKKFMDENSFKNNTYSWLKVLYAGELISINEKGVGNFVSEENLKFYIPDFIVKKYNLRDGLKLKITVKAERPEHLANIEIIK